MEPTLKKLIKKDVEEVEKWGKQMTERQQGKSWTLLVNELGRRNKPKNHKPENPIVKRKRIFDKLIEGN